jgi:hypothetical protein
MTSSVPRRWVRGAVAKPCDHYVAKVRHVHTPRRTRQAASTDEAIARVVASWSDEAEAVLSGALARRPAVCSTAEHAMRSIDSPRAGKARLGAQA